MSNEIDLHGLKPGEALEAFVRAYNRTRDTLRVVHGYGSTGTGGVIRRQIRALLEQHPDKLTWFAGENIDGNPGYTLVQHHKALPTLTDDLSSGILAYCVTPRTEEKIAGEFRKYTAREVKEAIRRLLKQGLIVESLKNGRRVFLKI